MSLASGVPLGRIRRIATALAVVAVIGFGAIASRAAPVPLAERGAARVPIVVAPAAGTDIRALAADCAAGLQRITGAEFQISSSSTIGLVIGTTAEWPEVALPSTNGRSEVLLRDDYVIRTEPGRILLIGRTAHGAANALWDFFYRVGFRQFFPGKTWEIWPRRETLAFEANVAGVPAYYTRDLRRGDGWPDTAEDFRVWTVRNRMASGFVLNTTHAYEAIIRSHPDFFRAHPEAITGNDGSGAARVQTKLDATVPGVLELVAADALKQLSTDPRMDSVRMDPSDGGGWRMDSPLGTPSDQAVTVANYVARAIQSDYPGRKVGMYAYGWHSPAPRVAVDPQVIVSVATAFLREGHTVESLLGAWHAQGAEMGIREYLSCWPWDYDLPGQSRAADPHYVATTIPKFHELGARYWSTSISNGWGAHGLGFYLASRVLWDLDEAKRVGELADDFYLRAFAGASATMRGFYQRYLLADGHPLLSEDLIGRMYRTLNDALQAEASAAVRARVYDLVAYTRFVDLMFVYKNAPAAQRATAFAELARYAYRARRSDMMNSYAVVFRDRDRSKPANSEFKALVDSLRKESDLTPPELLAILEQRIAETKINDFEPRGFSSALVPVAEMTSPEPVTGAYRLKGDNRLYLSKSAEQPAFTLKITAGLVYRDRGPARLRLYSEKHLIIDEPVAQTDVPPDRVEHEVVLRSPYEGLHRLEIVAGGDRTLVSWSAGTRVVLPSSPAEKAAIEGAYDVAFFVPTGTSRVGFYSGLPKGRMVSPDGRTVFDFATMRGPGVASVAVPPGQAGQCWRIVAGQGEKLLLTVPPYFARHPSELLVPREVAPALVP